MRWFANSYLWHWRVLVPFTARWVPTFLGLEQPHERVLLAGIVLDYAGVATAAFGFLPAACFLLLTGGLIMVIGLRVSEPALRPAKLIGVHRSFPAFVRIAYIWMIVAACLGLWASKADRAGGIWGRHAMRLPSASSPPWSLPSGPECCPSLPASFASSASA